MSKKLSDYKIVISPLRSAREQRGLTREKLARLAGVSTSTVTRMELGSHVPSGLALIGLARALDVTIDSLVSTSALGDGRHAQQASSGARGGDAA